MIETKVVNKIYKCKLTLVKTRKTKNGKLFFFVRILANINVRLIQKNEWI